jgi:hypothetical protein
MEGLAQSNNNATLNKGAKHDQTLLEMSAKSDESKRSNHGEGEVSVEGGRKKRAELPHPGRNREQRTRVPQG